MEKEKETKKTKAPAKSATAKTSTKVKKEKEQAQPKAEPKAKKPTAKSAAKPVAKKAEPKAKAEAKTNIKPTAKKAETKQKAEKKPARKTAAKKVESKPKAKTKPAAKKAVKKVEPKPKPMSGTEVKEEVTKEEVKKEEIISNISQEEKIEEPQKESQKASLEESQEDSQEKPVEETQDDQVDELEEEQPEEKTEEKTEEKPQEPKQLREPRPREDGPKSPYEVESVLDFNSINIWTLSEYTIAEIWEKERMDYDFSKTEDKLLNIIRAAFEVAHFDESDWRERARYSGSEWAHFSHCHPGRGTIAIRRRTIKKLSDLTYENIRHISAPMLLELINGNFGGGWDAIQLSVKDIIESGFDISTTQLPASMIHKPGGTLDKKVQQGFEVLEIPKGTWVEAIFAKKKDPVEKIRFESQGPMFDEDGNEIVHRDPLDADRFDDEEEDENVENEEIDNENGETFYSNYAEEANVKEEDEEGFPIVEGEEE